MKKQIGVIGLDIAKSVFQVHRIDMEFVVAIRDLARASLILFAVQTPLVPQ